MDLVVLAGSLGREPGWARGCPRPLLPIGGVTLLESLLARFDSFADGRSAVCANGQTGLLARRIRNRSDRRELVLVEDGVPRGVAGCLKACSDLVSSPTVFVCAGSVFLDDDPQRMLEAHLASGNALTVFCADSEPAVLGEERALRPTGLYCCQLETLEHIRPSGYQDLKEQWVPALQAAGLRVGAVVLKRRSTEIRSWSSYLSAIERSLAAGGPATVGCDELAPGVWARGDVRISPRSRIVGPVYLGRGCRIEPEATIAGPAVLSAGCCIEPGAFLSRVTTETAVRFGPGSSVVDRFVPSSAGGSAEPRLGRRTIVVRGAGSGRPAGGSRSTESAIGRPFVSRAAASD